MVDRSVKYLFSLLITLERILDGDNGDHGLKGIKITGISMNKLFLFDDDEFCINIYQIQEYEHKSH